MRALRRTRKALLADRAPTRSACPKPGPLLEWIPHVSPQLRAPRHLSPLLATLERALEQPIEVCVSVPPRHGKTTTIVHWIAWALATDPTLTILYASYAHGFAAKQVRRIRRLAIKWGVVLGDVRRADEWTTAEGGGVKAAGVGGQITGEGFRIIIVDDPHKNRAEAESATIREGVCEGFRDDIYTRQDPRGTSVVVVHTRWHVEDLIGQLSKPKENHDDPEPFELINLPAINARGRPLAPELWPLAALQKVQRRIGEYAWEGLFQGNPRPRGGRVFYDAVLFEGELPASMQVVIGVDLAHTAKRRSDWHAAVALGREPGSEVAYVLDVRHMQGRLTDVARDGKTLDEGFVRELVSLRRAYPGARLVMYTGSDEELVLHLLSQLRDNAVHVDARVAISDKKHRAEPYAARWNRGEIRVLRRAGWASGYVGEHTSWTGGPNEKDDRIDAGAAAHDALFEGDGTFLTTPSGAGKPRVDLSPRKRWTG